MKTFVIVDTSDKASETKKDLRKSRSKQKPEVENKLCHENAIVEMEEDPNLPIIVEEICTSQWDTVNDLLPQDCFFGLESELLGFDEEWEAEEGGSRVKMVNQLW